MHWNRIEWNNTVERREDGARWTHHSRALVAPQCSAQYLCLEVSEVQCSPQERRAQ